MFFSRQKNIAIWFAFIFTGMVTGSAIGQTLEPSTSLKPLISSKPIASKSGSTKRTPGKELKLDPDFDRFISWFGGEWNNNEQVWQQKADAEKLPGGKPVEPISHTHHIFAPVSAPKIGSHVFYVQQHLDADMSKAYRQRVYRLSKDVAENAVKLEIFTLPDDKTFFNAHLQPALFTSLDISALKATPGCEVYWRYNETTSAFTGVLKPNACSYFSQRMQKRIVVSDTLKLTQSEIWINDQARDEQGNYLFGSKTNTPVMNRKVRYYTGWLLLNRAGKEAKETDKEIIFRKDFVIHNEGQYLPVLWDDGTPSPYMLELAQLTYQNTKSPILKLALVDKESKKSVMYIWANTEATRLGMNLKWFQVGLTLKEDRVAYGFGDPPKSAAPSTSTSATATATATIPAPADKPASR